MANTTGMQGSFAPGFAPGEMSAAQAAALGVTGFAGPPSVNANSAISMANVAGQNLSFAPGPANTPANTSFAPATAPQAPDAPQAPQAPGTIGETTQTGQLAGITQSQAIADAMQNDPGFNAQVANPTGYAIGKGINEAMPSNLYGQLDTVQAPTTVFSNIALENPGKNQPTKSDMTVEEALDAVFGTPTTPEGVTNQGWSFGKSSPENPDPDTGLTVGLSPPDTGMFGDVGITAAPGGTLGPTSSPGQIAGFGDALAGAEAAQAAQGAPSGDAPADSPGISFGGTQGENDGNVGGSSLGGSAAVGANTGDPGGGPW
jgi:hypothetical protein